MSQRGRLTYLRKLWDVENVSIDETNELLDLIRDLEGDAALHQFISIPENSGKLDRIRLKGNDSINRKFKSHLFLLSWGKPVLAAALVLIIALAAFLLRFCLHRKEEIKNAYISFNELPDGSNVILNAGSSLRYDFQNKRELELNGNAYFTIAANPRFPFTILTPSGIKTVVLGTSFTIDTRKPDYPFILNVNRGKVKVIPPKGNCVIADSGRQVRITNQHISEVTGIDPTAQGWVKEGLFFENKSIEQIAAVLSERYNSIITIQSDTLKNRTITIRFSGTETITNIMESLSEFLDCRYVVQGKSILLY